MFHCWKANRCLKLSWNCVFRLWPKLTFDSCAPSCMVSIGSIMFVTWSHFCWLLVMISLESQSLWTTEWLNKPQAREFHLGRWVKRRYSFHSHPDLYFCSGVLRNHQTEPTKPWTVDWKSVLLSIPPVLCQFWIPFTVSAVRFHFFLWRRWRHAKSGAVAWYVLQGLRHLRFVKSIACSTFYSQLRMDFGILTGTQVVTSKLITRVLQIGKGWLFYKRSSRCTQWHHDPLNILYAI